MNTYARIESYVQLDRVAIIFEDRRYTYRDLFQLVDGTARYLTQVGVQTDQRVVVFLPNIPEFIVLYLACLKIGAIPASVSISLANVEIEKILSDCQGHCVFTESSLAGKLNEIIGISSDNLHVFGQHLDLVSLLHQHPPGPPLPTVARQDDDPAAILYTSGTTGSPKGVVLTHGNVHFNSTSVINCTPINQNDKSLIFLPLFHCFAQNHILNASLQAGAAVVLLRRYDFDHILELTEKGLITLFFAVPTIYYRILQSETTPDKFASVRYYFSAAAPLKPHIAAQWQQTFGHAIHQGYGLTESSPMATYNPIPEQKTNSVGTPVEGVQIKLLDEEGKEVQVGEPGEIVLKGPNVMQGYFRKEEETERVLKDGWLKTGDIGKRDVEGYYYILQRKKELIIVSGFNVLPSEVEAAALELSQVADIAVFAWPDPERGEVVGALVVPRSPTLTETQLRNHLLQRLAKYKVPAKMIFRERIERSETGKLNQARIKELYSLESVPPLEP